MSGSLLLQATRLLLVCGTEMPVLPWVGWGNSDRFEHEEEVVNVKGQEASLQTNKKLEKIDGKLQRNVPDSTAKRKESQGRGIFCEAGFNAGTIQNGWDCQACLVVGRNPCSQPPPNRRAALSQRSF